MSAGETGSESKPKPGTPGYKPAKKKRKTSRRSDP